MSKKAENSKADLTNKKERKSLFDKLTKLFMTSPEYAAGYLIMHGSYVSPETLRK